jgi:uncharacterized protein
MAAPVLLGALTQRATGLGFALVASPFLVAIAGAQAGVSLSNALSALVCVLVLVRTWRQVRWRPVALLALGAAVTVPVGALVVAQLPDGPLLVLVGAMVVLAVGIVAASGRRVLLQGTAGALAAGALSGFMNVTAGVGGPMASAYGLSQRWDRAVIVPTTQACLLLINTGSLAAKGLPDLPVAAWVVGFVALAVGVLGGEWVDKRLGSTTGRRVIIVVALAGGVAAIVRGVMQLALG